MADWLGQVSWLLQPPASSPAEPSPESSFGDFQVDGYGGYAALARRGDVRLAFYWAHVRRRLFELAKGGAARAANEVLARIAQLYAI